jgi:excisionase family DNA binding protein
MEIVTITTEQLDSLIRRVISEELNKNQESKEEKLITRTEACELLSITKPTLYSYCKKGLLNIYSIGGKQKMKLSELNDFIKEKSYK